MQRTAVPRRSPATLDGAQSRASRSRRRRSPDALDAKRPGARRPRPRQRAGARAAAAIGPLLVIAGAGSGKTLTLAARRGPAGPRRRRPAAPAAADVLAPRRARDGAPRRPRAARGARPRRRRSAAAAAVVRHLPQRRRAAAARRARARIGLDESLHRRRPRRLRGPDADRCASASAWPSGAQPLSAEGDLPGDLLARRQHAAAARRRAGRDSSRGAASTRTRCAACSPPTPPRSRQQRVLDFDDLLLSGGPRRWPTRSSARAIGARFDHVLVDEYQDTNRLQAEIVLQRCARRGRGLTVGRRRRAVDLRLPRRRGAQHPRLRRPLRAAGAGARRWSRTTARRAPLLAASNAVIALAAERSRQEAVERSRRRPSGRALVWVEDEAAQAPWVAERVLALRETGPGAEAPGGALPQRRSTACRSSSS